MGETADVDTSADPDSDGDGGISFWYNGCISIAGETLGMFALLAPGIAKSGAEALGSSVSGGALEAASSSSGEKMSCWKIFTVALRVSMASSFSSRSSS